MYLMPAFLLLILRFKMMEAKSRARSVKPAFDGVAPPIVTAAMRLTFFGFHSLIIKGIQGFGRK